MEIKHLSSIPGTTPENEDGVGYHGEYFWVIDGATDLYNSYELIGYSVSEVVQLICEALPKYCNDEVSLAEILKQVIQKVAKAIGLERLSACSPEYLPSFSIVLCRLNNGQLDYLLLGDCYLVINKEILTDERVTSFFNRSIQRIEEGLNKGENLNRKEIFRKVRSLLNQPSGYWIGSLDGLGLEHAIIGSRFLLPGDSVILMSDGFYEDYSKNQNKDLKILIEQRASKAVDPIFGKRDDASIISVSV